MLATAPVPVSAPGQVPPPAYSTALLPIVRVSSVLGAQTAPNTVLGMERGAVKLVTLSPAAEAKIIEVRLLPLVDNKPAANPATQMDLAKLAADTAPLMVFFPGSKLYLGSAAGKKLMFSMRAVPLQAWAVVRPARPNPPVRQSPRALRLLPARVAPLRAKPHPKSWTPKPPRLQKRATTALKLPCPWPSSTRTACNT
ncbi:hypothetical protein BCR44DRAFT_1434179 [Catenaria anguillulae PL171]|uniref:Uncharacterized protein n=1 Tax=Catenaria anguillulae PL171 TaxID=765915 RepID=A0A1Y2HNN1_9FUNG|nr:hypothetical protein BCR44DRAFT_1434179 [Catenaria anguillulae PL171]